MRLEGRLLHLVVSQPGSESPEDSNLPAERKSCKVKGVSSTHMGFFQLMWIKNRQLKTGSGLQNSGIYLCLFRKLCVLASCFSNPRWFSLKVREGMGEGRVVYL